MSLGDSIAEFLKQSSPSFEAERLILRTTEMIIKTMDAQNVSRVELAKTIGKSKGHISQLLSGKRNMTLKTLAEIAFALNVRVNIDASSLDIYHDQRSGKALRQYSLKDRNRAIALSTVDRSLSFFSYPHRNVGSTGRDQAENLLQKDPDLDFSQINTFFASVIQADHGTTVEPQEWSVAPVASAGYHSPICHEQTGKKTTGGPALAA